MQQTHAQTHNMYKMVVKEVIAVERSSETEQFKDHGNRYFLFLTKRTCVAYSFTCGLQDATLAWITADQLGWNIEPGAENCSTRSSCHWLHGQYM